MSGPGYVISTVRAAPGNVAVFEVVTDQLQRMFISMPQARTDADQIDATIRATIAALYAKPSPVR